VAWSHSKKLVLLMKILDQVIFWRRFVNVVVSSISFSEAMDEPRMWKTTK